MIPLPGGLVANDFITNPNLQPEEALGWEAGLAFKFENVVANGDILRVKGARCCSHHTRLASSTGRARRHRIR